MKQISYTNEFKDKGHHCSTLLIRCMDFRFHKALEDNIGTLIGEQTCIFDSPGVGGGGSKSIIDEDGRKVVFAALDIAIAKHHISKIIIVDHIDCGAFGGSGEFADEKAEEDFHCEKLAEAKEILAQQYPNMEINLVYQDWNTIKMIS